MNNKLEILSDEGIIDPIKVIRKELKNSCSVVGLLMITQAVMFHIFKNETSDIKENIIKTDLFKRGLLRKLKI